MDVVCGGPKPYLSADQLELEHTRCREKALEQFQLKRKMGGDEFSESYRAKLESVIILKENTSELRLNETIAREKANDYIDEYKKQRSAVLDS